MAEEGDKNTLFSPLSLSIAFAMICWGESKDPCGAGSTKTSPDRDTGAGGPWKFSFNYC